MHHWPYVVLVFRDKFTDWKSLPKRCYATLLFSSAGYTTLLLYKSGFFYRFNISLSICRKKRTPFHIYHILFFWSLVASQCLDWITAVFTWLPFFFFFLPSTMTSLFFPFSPQLNIVQLYQEECVMVLLLAGNFPVHTASMAPVQNNLMVFMRRSCKHKLKSLHATSISALLLFLISNLQGTVVMDHSLSYGWLFRRKGSSVQQIEWIHFWVRNLVIYLHLRY